MLNRWFAKAFLSLVDRYWTFIIRFIFWDDDRSHSCKSSPNDQPCCLYDERKRARSFQWRKKQVSSRFCKRENFEHDCLSDNTSRPRELQRVPVAPAPYPRLVRLNIPDPEKAISSESATPTSKTALNSATEPSVFDVSTESELDVRIVFFSRSAWAHFILSLLVMVRQNNASAVRRQSSTTEKLCELHE